MLQPTYVRLFYPGGHNLVPYPTVAARRGLALVAIACAIVIRETRVKQIGYAIIHVPTGMRIGKTFQTEETGKDAFNDITTLDWTDMLTKHHFRLARRWGAIIRGSTQKTAENLWRYRIK